ncbi:aminopeptidase [Variovorax sp. OV329]|uniref:aminopeptidase n=1 Tax=Variovorax sp. OV329 TaxID=1882825 RepID=UPI0008E6F0F1|nr:aminopeptidase [Variovorax sp. OV329]SFN07453.1 Predicted aminopeptidase [Variovorax sp. OV329]
MSRGWPRLLAVAALAAVLVGCTGCSNLGYYWQAATGHVDLMRAAKPVPEWLDDPQTSQPLKDRLLLAQRIRNYASSELGLPDNKSYTAYADLKRPAALWNVVAAPPYSLQLYTWCFPVAGCVGYRGYYVLADAQSEAERLKAQGLEVSVYPVPAYSTLGWLNWAGGDPLLSSFIGYPEGELARLLFHELAHQVVYVPDDTTFNESFATAVERLGGERWLATQAPPGARDEYLRFDAQRRGFRALALDTRAKLQAVYSSPEAAAQDWPVVEQQKKAVMAEFRERYAQLRAGWSGPRQAAYDAWVARANNAMFGAQAAYDAQVPGFEALFNAQAAAGGDPWPRFFAQVKKLAQLPKPERDEALGGELPRAEGGAPADAPKAKKPGDTGD